MNLKTIIKEKMGDFSWIEEIEPSFIDFIKQYGSENGEYSVLINDISMEEQLTMMDKLYDHGFHWRGGHGRYDTSRLKIPVIHLRTDTMELQWDSIQMVGQNSTKIPTEEFFRSLGMSVDNISESNELKRIIREEINDFSWIEPNPIEVGKCLTLKSNSHGDVLVKVSKIKTLKNDTDKLNDLAILNRTRVYFDMVYTGYPAMSLTYIEVENYINSGDIVPCDCPTVKESKNKLIKESGVENYLQSIASITSGNQKKYYNWVLSNLEKVPVVSYRSNEELKDKVDSFVKRMRRTGDFCEKKGCFDTAYNTAMYVPGVHYIEGYVQSIIPIVHAWNYLPEEGIYFDLINDIAWKEEDSHFNEYYKVIDLDKNGVLKWSSKTGYGGGFMESPQFIDSVVNKENINESFSDEWGWTKGKVYTVGQIIELGSENILKEDQIIYLTGKIFKDKSPDSTEFLDLDHVPVKVMTTYKKGRGFKVVTIEGSEELKEYVSNNILYLGMVDRDAEIMVTF